MTTEAIMTRALSEQPPRPPRSEDWTDAPSPEDPRWMAIVQRDRTGDYQFFYGVTTTGIYCRPGCSSRRPRRENVRLFATTGMAEASGFRPCRRCAPAATDPRDLREQVIRHACRALEAAEDPPSLATLAKAAHLGPTRFQRLFKQVVGLSPKQYGIAVREGRMDRALRSNVPVTRAVYEAGYASASRFYENGTPRLGMKPSQFARGGAGLQICFALGSWSLGQFLLATTDRGICALELGDDARELEARLQRRFPKAVFEQDPVRLRSAVAGVTRALENPGQRLAVPYDLRGTPFQRRVWKALQAIPPGTTLSYANLARRVGSRAARPVANAVAANPVAVLIPCHRVVRTDGSLGGYRWGLARKRQLLSRERP